jgi:hypothetical protein
MNSPNAVMPAAEPIGTVIHPSVYFLRDIYSRVGISKGLKPLNADLDAFREEASLRFLPQHEAKYDPWVVDQYPTRSGNNTCRILVCGTPETGKSSLINRVFGIEMVSELLLLLSLNTVDAYFCWQTDVRNNSLGQHDIDQAFESEYHPGIILHDSEGFQSGGDDEIIAFKRFFDKTSRTGPGSQLDAVWYVFRHFECALPLRQILFPGFVSRQTHRVLSRMPWSRFSSQCLTCLAMFLSLL